MSKIIKPLKIFALLLFATLLLVSILITFLTIKSLPDYNRTVVNSLVKQDVKIFRNKYAIPNIVSKTNEDTFFALGYVHAQDRLWQMELMRRTGSGRLSEILGHSALQFDKYTRTLGFYKTAQDRVGSLSSKLHQNMTAYVAGINYHINM